MPDEPIEVKLAKPPSGMQLRIPPLGVAVLLALFVAFLFWIQATGDRAPKYSPTTPAPYQSTAGAPWLVVIVAVLGGLFVVILGGILAYAILRAAISLREAAANARAAEVAARQVRRDENGHLPAVLTRDGDTLIDPDVAPAGVVRGLQCGAAPEMPEPATAEHRRAADRAAFTRFARATGGIGPAGAALFGQQAAGGQMPPVVRVEEMDADTGRLIEAALGDYKLLPEREE
jgi:hypothetical protein